MFRWKSQGFTIKMNGKGKVDLASFSDVLSKEKVEQLINLGLFFYHPIHRVSIETMEDYHKYIEVVN